MALILQCRDLMVSRTCLFIAGISFSILSFSAHATLSDSVKSRWGSFCAKYLVAPDYRATLKTNIVQKMNANVEDEDVRIEQLVAKYRMLGGVRWHAAEALGRGERGLVILAEDSFICGVMMVEIGNELRRIILRRHSSLSEQVAEKIRDAFEDYRIFEKSCVVVKNQASRKYEIMDVEDF